MPTVKNGSTAKPQPKKHVDTSESLGQHPGRQNQAKPFSETLEIDAYTTSNETPTKQPNEENTSKEANSECEFNIVSTFSLEVPKQDRTSKQEKNRLRNQRRREKKRKLEEEEQKQIQKKREKVTKAIERKPKIHKGTIEWRFSQMKKQQEKLVQ